MKMEEVHSDNSGEIGENSDTWVHGWENELPSINESDLPINTLVEEKEIASRAVAFVVNSTRKGIVPLCTDVANLLRAKKSLEKKVMMLTKENEALRLMSRPTSHSTSPTPASLSSDRSIIHESSNHIQEPFRPPSRCSQCSSTISDSPKSRQRPPSQQRSPLGSRHSGHVTAPRADAHNSHVTAPRADTHTSHVTASRANTHNSHVTVPRADAHNSHVTAPRADAHNSHVITARTDVQNSILGQHMAPTINQRTEAQKLQTMGPTMPRTEAPKTAWSTESGKMVQTVNQFESAKMLNGVPPEKPMRNGVTTRAEVHSSRPTVHNLYEKNKQSSDKKNDRLHRYSQKSSHASKQIKIDVVQDTKNIVEEIANLESPLDVEKDLKYITECLQQIEVNQNRDKLYIENELHTFSEPKVKVQKPNNSIGNSKQKIQSSNRKWSRALSPSVTSVCSEPIKGCKCMRCESALLKGDEDVNDAQKFSVSYKLQVQLGDYVVARGDKSGKICYIGHLDNTPDVLNVGIELAQPVGQHDGCYQKKRYFKCKKDHGILIPLQDILCKVNKKPQKILRSPSTEEKTEEVTKL